MKRILVADNDDSFSKALVSLLKREGYDVITAREPVAAEKALRESHVHLAILDVRLSDDTDEMDDSGLALAKKADYSRIPKIILTSFPDFMIARDALADSTEGRPAVDFLAKKQEPRLWIDTIHQAFQRHVKVNWELKVTSAQTAPGFSQICESIYPGIKGELLSERAAELQEIFQRLFFVDEEIRIDRLLWNRGGRVALVVSSFSRERLPQGFVVVCGLADTIGEEARRFSKYSPKESGPGQTTLERSVETAHFGGACYSLFGAALEDMRSLHEIYDGSEISFKTLSKTLFARTLTHWHGQRRIVEAERTLDNLYRENLDLPRIEGNDDLRSRVESLASRLPMIRARFEFHEDTVTFDINGKLSTYPDPVASFYRSFDFPKPVPMIITPGTFSVETAYACHSDGPWLTDFSKAGPAPVAWNHVAVEAAIRFDLVRSTSLSWIHQMERALVAGDFAKLYAEDMEGPMKKAVKAIQVVRKDAIDFIGSEVSSYHLGIFFHAASRLSRYDPDSPIRDKELAPFAHLLLAMCEIAARLREKRIEIEMTAETEEPIAIDKENRRVTVDGLPVSLRGNGYQLLCYLFDRAGRLCDRKEIYEAVFDEAYDAIDENQQSKLNTAVHRLRERIEEDPDDARYLITEPGGYRLFIRKNN